MSKLNEGQDCFLHKGSESKVFKFGSQDYKMALKDNWVSSIREAKLQLKRALIEETIEEVSDDSQELEGMSVGELRKLGKNLGVCCLSKSDKKECIVKILEFYNEHKSN